MTTQCTPILLAVGAIDEASRLVIEHSGGRVGRASTGGEDELAVLLVQLPADTAISEYLDAHGAEIALHWEGVTHRLRLQQGRCLAEAEITWASLD